MNDTVSRKAVELLQTWLEEKRGYLSILIVRQADCKKWVEAGTKEQVEYYKPKYGEVSQQIESLKIDMEDVEQAISKLSTELKGETAYKIDIDRGRVFQGSREWHIVPDELDIPIDQFFDDFGAPKWIGDILTENERLKEIDERESLIAINLKRQNERLLAAVKQAKNELTLWNSSESAANVVASILDEALKGSTSNTKVDDGWRVCPTCAEDYRAGEEVVIYRVSGTSETAVYRIRDLLDNSMSAGAYRVGVNDALNALGITIPGIEDGR